MNHKKAAWSLLSGLVLLSLVAHSHAQTVSNPIGYVKTVTGEASVVTAGQHAAALPGVAIQIGSQLKTASASTMGVVFKDGTVMSFGPDTELTVDEYLYAPNQDELKLSTRLVKGSLNYVSGVIAKLKPDAVTIKTPASIIGVRGTQFVVKVESIP